MKKTLLSGILWLFALWACAQTTITVSGAVTRPDGSAVENWHVSAFVTNQDSTQVAFAEVTTNSNGFYEMEIVVLSGNDEVLVVTEDGCSPSNSAWQVVAVVNNAATADFEICGNTNPTANCEAFFTDVPLGNLTVQFSPGFISFDGSAPATWAWDFGDGNSSTGQNPEHTYAEAGIYEVTLTVVSTSGCEATIVQHIFVGNVQPGCVAWFEFIHIDSLSLQFTGYFQSFDSSATLNWQWDFGDGNTSTIQNPAHTYDEAGIYEVTLTVVNDLTGCETTITQHVFVGQVNPNPNCFVVPEYDWLDSLTFEFSSVFFGLDGADAETWYWDFGDGNTSDEATPTHTYDEDGFYLVSLVVTSATGCEASIQFPIFTGVPYPFDCQAYIDYEPTADSLTFSFNANLFDINGDSTIAISYFWEFEDGTTSNDPNPTHTFPENGVYSVALTALTSDSCLVQTCAIVIVGGGSPVDTFFYGCQALFFVSEVGADSLTLSFEDISFGSPMAWLWEFGDGTTSTEQNPTHTYAEPGVYVIELSIVTATGCESNISFEVCVNEDCTWQDELDCQALFIPLPDSLGGSGFQFFDLSYSPSPIQSWTWDFGDGTASNEQSPYHEYAQAGEYTVTLSIESDDCESEISFVLNTDTPWNFAQQVAALGVATGSMVSTQTEPVAFAGLRMFPNPVSNTCYVVFEAQEAADYVLTIRDITGRAIQSQSAIMQVGSNTVTVDANALLPGFYTVEIRTTREAQTLKMIKQR
jgi:PKD repeat protein